MALTEATTTVPVFLMNGEQVLIEAPPRATVQQVFALTASRLQLGPAAPSFSLWAISGVRSLLTLELEDDYVVEDLFVEWTRLLRYLCEKKKRRKTPDWYEARITLGLASLTPRSVVQAWDEPGLIRLVYYEALHSILHSKYFPLTLERAVEFAALQLQVSDGDFQKKKHKKDMVAERTRSLFARSFTRMASRLELAEMVIPRYKKMKGKTQTLAQVGFLELMWEEPLFGASIYETTCKEAPPGAPFAVDSYIVFAFRADGLRLCRLRTMEVVHFISYEDIVLSSYVETTFTLSFVAPDMREITYACYTKKGTILSDHVERGFDLNFGGVAPGANATRPSQAAGSLML